MLSYHLHHGKLTIAAYTDAAHHVNGLSHEQTGYCIIIKDSDSGIILAVSKIQTIISLSTTESETVAAVEATKEIIWYCNMLGDRT